MKNFYLIVVLTMITFTSVLAQVSADFSADITKGCDELTVKFTDNSTGATAWFWDFGNGQTSTEQNPTTTYSGAGFYGVSLRASDNTGDFDVTSKSSYISVYKTPSPDFSTSYQLGCNSLNPLIKNNTAKGTALTYSWDFGDGSSSTLKSPSHTYSGEGVFSMNLTVTESGTCSSSAEPVEIEVKTFVADFSIPATVCQGEVVELTDLTIGDSKSVAYNFGDGTALSDVTEYSYSKSGTFEITQTATSIDNCKSYSTATIEIKSLPVPGASLVQNAYCQVPFMAEFTNTSTSSNGAITSIEWNSDGFTGSGESFSPTYTTFGTKSVLMTITDEFGCTATGNPPVAVWLAPPEVAYTVDVSGGCIPLTVNFEDASSTNSSPIDQWSWDFGNGESSSNTAETISYNDTGSYDVVLTVSTADGCTNTKTFNGAILAGIPPTASFSTTQPYVCQEETVVFQSVTSAFTDTWNWGDVPTGNSMTDTESLSSSDTPKGEWHINREDTGFYDVRLTPAFHKCQGASVTIDSAFRILTPVSYITISKAIACEAPLVLNIADTSKGADSYVWNMGIPAQSGGDSIITTQEVPQPFTYQSEGIYDISLTTTATSFGRTCTSTQTKTVGVAKTEAYMYVIEEPTVGCSPLQINLKDSSSTNTDFVSSQWILQSESGAYTYNGFNPSVSIPNAGIYDITHSVTDSLGCTFESTYVNVLEVKGLPLPAISLNDSLSCVGDEVEFSDVSIPYLGSTIEASYWNFDNTPADTGNTVTRSFNLTGYYDISLTVVDNYGCIDSITNVGMLSIGQPKVQVSTSSIVICNNDSISFTPKIVVLNSSISKYNLEWDFKDGSVSNDTNVVHQFSLDADSTVTLPVTLTVDNYVFGCTTEKVVDILVSIPKANFSSTDTNITCYPTTVQFTDRSSFEANRWEWDFGDGTLSSSKNPSHDFVVPDTLDFTLRTYNSYGCSDTLFVPGMITVAGPSGIVTGGVLPGSCDKRYVLASDVTSADSVVWEITNLDTDEQEFVQTDTLDKYFFDEGTYSIGLALYDKQSGCRREASAPASLDAFSILESGIDAYFEVNSEYPEENSDLEITDLSSTSNSSISEWLWFLGKDSSKTLTEQPVVMAHQFPGPGNYTVSLQTTDNLGCIDIFSRDIEVIESYIGYNAMTPNGDGINDCVDIELYGVSRYNLNIFNRGGKLVYTINCVNEVAWCGEDMSGKIVPDGTYYFVAETVDIGGAFNQEKGFIEVMGGN